MGRVVDTLTWDAYKVELKQYCNISSTSHDTILGRFMVAAARHADEYIKNGFSEEQVTITLADVEADDSVMIDGATFTAATATDATEREFKIGVSDEADAVALLALINSGIIGGSTGAVGVPTVIGTSALGVITLKHRYPNENAIAVSSSNDDRLAVALLRVDLDIPDEIIVWCWQYVAWRFGNRDGRKAERAEMGIGSIEWGQQPDETILELYVARLLEMV